MSPSDMFSGKPPADSFPGGSAWPRPLRAPGPGRSGSGFSLHPALPLLLQALLLLLAGTRPALADGVFKSSLLRPVPIPQQTAVLQHHEGVETLTIWNTVEAEGQELAWVLPLPAVPDAIGNTRPEALQLLRVLSAPQVKDSRWPQSLYLIPALAITGFGVRLLFLRRPHSTVGLKLLIYAGFGLIFLAAAGYTHTMPGVRTTAGSTAAEEETKDGVNVLSSGRAGDYTTHVITGTSPDVVNEWLTRRGFPAFEGRELETVRDCLSRNWVFLCSRLADPEEASSSSSREASAPAVPAPSRLSAAPDARRRPPPLTVRFRCEAPLYPMRLTAGAGTVPVELFMLGGGNYVDPTGRLQATARTPARFDGIFRNLREALSMQEILRAEFEEGRPSPSLAEYHRHHVPAGQDLMLDALLTGGQTLTRLSGTFGPDSDWSDITLVPADGARLTAPPHYTLSGFIQHRVTPWAAAASLGALLLGSLAQADTATGRHPRLIWPAAGLTLLTVSFGSLFFSSFRPIVLTSPEHTIRLHRGSDSHPSLLLEKWWQPDSPPDALSGSRADGSAPRAG